MALIFASINVFFSFSFCYYFFFQLRFSLHFALYQLLKSINTCVCTFPHFLKIFFILLCWRFLYFS